jgi:microcystin-dependent protein
MSQPYVGEIRMFAGNFAPAGWMFCDGSLLPISEFETLFNLIGTTYGGDGQATFALPNLLGRVPIHMGNGPGGFTNVLAQSGGTETVTLTAAQTPVHTHGWTVMSVAGTADKEKLPGGYLANGTAPGNTVYTNDPAPAAQLSPSMVGPFVGGSQPHNNVAPYLAVNFIISMFGVFPSQT